MQFYNPFRAHVIENNGLYYVRRLTIKLFSWEYLDRTHNDGLWWMNTVDYKTKWCSLTSDAAAFARLRAYREGQHKPAKIKERRIKEGS